MLSGCGEMVDTLVLGTSGESRGGSSPSIRTIFSFFTLHVKFCMNST